jgi:glycosyltransferase involved in cell wall biosynthesis
VFVLPSLSEGAPRAALEALFLGVPCVLRNVDGNACLVSSGVNGVLFQTDDQLLEAIKGAVVLARKLRGIAGDGKKNNLLPDRNR